MNPGAFQRLLMRQLKGNEQKQSDSKDHGRRRCKNGKGTHTSIARKAPVHHDSKHRTLLNHRIIRLSGSP
jgi:hypothetical protein